MSCSIPPPGWYCTRVAGHDGPCAALPYPKSTQLSPEERVIWDAVCEMYRERVNVARRERNEAQAEVSRLRALMAEVATSLDNWLDGDHTVPSSAWEELLERVSTEGKAHRCTCEILIEQVEHFGKSLESSCEVHEWRLVNRVLPK